MVGIIVAVSEELDAIKLHLKNSSVEEAFGTKFYVGEMKSKNGEGVKCVVVLCGVGKVNAARTAQLLIDKYNPEYVINVGVAGGISDKVKIGDIVIGDKLVQYDFDLTAFGRELGELSGGLGKYICSDKALVIKAHNILVNDDQVKGVLGIIASGDRFVTDTKVSKEVNKIFEADCVEMEGAAIAQVCHIDNVPFVVIRSISDSPNDNNKVDYDTFVSSASKTVADFVHQFVLVK